MKKMKEKKKEYTGLMWEQKPPQSIIKLARTSQKLIGKQVKIIIMDEYDCVKPSIKENAWTIKL